MNKLLPTITILTLSYNPPLELLERSLQSIAMQEYPSEKVQHILVDGGSREETHVLAKKYGCEVLVRKDYVDDSEGRRSFGVNAAGGDVILWLETDNILPHKTALQELVRPFLLDEKIMGAYSLHYNYHRKMSLIDRYCALFGVSDPVAMYLGKADREPYYHGETQNGTIISSNEFYDTVEFTKESLPTIGDNGFVVRRSMLIQATITPENFFHTDIFIDLLDKGFNRFAVIRATATENYVDTSLSHLVSRRSFYMQRDGSSASVKRRRYAIFDPHKKSDVIRLLLFAFYTITIIQPLYLSIRGFFVIRDKAWFLHPVVCWFYLIAYTKARMQLLFKK